LAPNELRDIFLRMATRATPGLLPSAIRTDVSRSHRLDVFVRRLSESGPSQFESSGILPEQMSTWVMTERVVEK